MHIDLETDNTQHTPKIYRLRVRYMCKKSHINNYSIAIQRDIRLQSYSNNGTHEIEL